MDWIDRILARMPASVILALAALVTVVAMLSGSIGLGIAGIILTAVVLRHIIQWINRGHDPQQAKRPPDPP